MAEGICYVCNQVYKAADKDTLVNELARHMMTAHLGWVRRDSLEMKNKFKTCPVCGGVVDKPLTKCPNCGADLIEQFARKIAAGYAK
jgi:anaerobic ribonucleoside-triphosphate reductase